MFYSGKGQKQTRESRIFLGVCVPIIVIGGGGGAREVNTCLATESPLYTYNTKNCTVVRI